MFLNRVSGAKWIKCSYNCILKPKYYYAKACVGKPVVILFFLLLLFFFNYKNLIKLQLLEILHWGNLIQHRRCVNQFISEIYKGSTSNQDTSNAIEKMESWRWDLIWYSNFPLLLCATRWKMLLGIFSEFGRRKKSEKDQTVSELLSELQVKIRL